VLGNLLATFAVPALAGRARGAVLRGRGAGEHRAAGGLDAVGVGTGASGGSGADAAPGGGRVRTKVAEALEKYGVPGVCLLGPLVVASQITAPTLVALGAAKGRVYLWMGVSIVIWGLAFGLFGGVLASVTA
jgi:hypothetical protein